MYCFLSSKVTCLFAFNYSGVDNMGGYLKGIDQDKEKDNIVLNICKETTSL